jgi:ketosteroid isomerase-like protein
MKFFTVIATMLPLLASAQINTKEQLHEKEQSEVLKTIKEWNNTFSANNPDAYFEFIHDEITLFLPGSPYRVDGKHDDREEFEYSLKKGWTRVGFFQEMQPKIQLIGNIAIVTYHNRGTYGEGDKEKTINLKETDVLVKEDGKWKVIHIHVSSAN